MLVRQWLECDCLAFQLVEVGYNVFPKGFSPFGLWIALRG